MRAVPKHRLLQSAAALIISVFLLEPGTAAMAQSFGGLGSGMMGFGDGGCGDGPGATGFGMMGQGSGYGPGMMSDAGSQSGGIVATRLADLKDELKVTSVQEAAWKTYSEATQAAYKELWGAMSGMHQRGMMWDAIPEERLDLMGQMIQLRQAQVGQLSAAAEALMPHLSEFQKGQATEILPGVGRSGLGPCGMGF